MAQEEFIYGPRSSERGIKKVCLSALSLQILLRSQEFTLL